jgi:hypothetical protein
MELLFVVLIAFGIGGVFRYALPGRDTYGSMLVPSVSAALSAAVWVGLTWLGWKFDGGWIWVVSLAAGGVIAIVLCLTIPHGRRSNDAELLQRLSRA